MPRQFNANFLTGGLGEALAKQNEITLAALRKDGHLPAVVISPPKGKNFVVFGKTSIEAGPLIPTGNQKLDERIGARLVGDWPFTHDLGLHREFAAMGRHLVGDVGRPIVWPDMKKVAEEARAARAPMSDETKEKLRALSAAKPRSVGDETARALEGKTLPEVYEVAAKALGEDVKALIDKYKHLNPGQQRMVCGNRMRAKWKAENLYAKTRGAGTNAGENERPSDGIIQSAPSPRVSTKGGEHEKGTAKSVQQVAAKPASGRPTGGAHLSRQVPDRAARRDPPAAGKQSGKRAKPKGR